MIKNKSSTQMISKPWGYEVLFAENDMYVGKILHINKGERLSLQYHNKKHETMYISTGSCKVTRNDKTDMAGPGECFEIRPGMIHRVEAINETEIFEVSTPELDDIIRLEDDYDRSKPLTDEQTNEVVKVLKDIMKALEKK